MKNKISPKHVNMNDIFQTPRFCKSKKSSITLTIIHIKIPGVHTLNRSNHVTYLVTLRNPSAAGAKTRICCSDGRDENIGTVINFRLASGNCWSRSCKSLSTDSISSCPVKKTSISPRPSSKWIWQNKDHKMRKPIQGIQVCFHHTKPNDEL